jgi:hypothetical protein
LAIVGNAVELPGSPRASFAVGKHTIDRKFLVQTDDVATGPIEVCLAPGLPVQFQRYSFGEEWHPTCRARSHDPERLGTSKYWVVTVHYETPERKERAGRDGGNTGAGNDPNSGDGGGTGDEKDGQFENLELEIPQLQCHYEVEKIPVEGIYNSKTQNYEPLRASTGEIYNPPAMMDASSLVITITRNEPLTANPQVVASLYMDAVNSDNYFGFKPGYLKMQSITFSREVKQVLNGLIQIPYLRVTYIMRSRALGWDLKLLDKGTWFYLQNSQDLTKPKIKQAFLTDDGSRRDGLLDGNGGKLPDNGNWVWNTFQVYRRLPFNALNLPTDFTQVQ